MEATCSSETSAGFQDITRYYIPEVRTLHNQMLYRHFQLCFRNASRIIKDNQERLELNGNFQLLIHLDDANLLDRTINTIKKEAKMMLDASKDMKFLRA
jgi:hypothetical protein